MIVLFTNIGFARRTGTEVLTADLARSLQAQGHTPMVYSPCLGEVAGEIRSQGIPVSPHLSEVPFEPDVIHGHHHLETVQAIQAFPRSPALFVCHDVTAWHDEVPRHPNIVSFVAVGLNARKRLIRDWPRTRAHIDVIGNGVDTTRFRPRAPLPAKPRRALVFSNDAGSSSHWESVAAACARAGIPVDRVGLASGNQTRQPGKLLLGYDLVFAKGRCALEAAAVGCSVILCDIQGLGTMLTSRNVEHLVAWNFGMRTLNRDLDAKLIAHEIKRYDPHDALRVRSYIRGHATLDHAVDRYLEVYERIRAKGVPSSAHRIVSRRYPNTRPLEIADQALLHLEIVGGPREVRPGKPVQLRVRLKNLASVPIGTSPPWPALFFQRWFTGDSATPLDMQTPRSILQPPLWPGKSREYFVWAVAPPAPGRFRCRVTLIQEGWRWLDELAPRVFADHWVQVTELTDHARSPD